MTNSLSPAREFGAASGLAARKSRAAEVADHIAEIVRARGLAEGARIGTAVEVQESLGVAKSTVDQAIKLLVEREQIYAKTGPNGGLFVAATHGTDRLLRRYFVARTADPRTAAEVLAVRDHLEEMLARDALHHVKPEQLRTISDVLDRMAAADPSDFVDHIWDFHRAIAAAAGNRTLADLYSAVLATVIDAVSATGDVRDRGGPPDYHRKRVEVHRAIYDALVARDERALAVALDRHLG